MRTNDVRRIIKEYKLNIVVEGRTNGSVKAISFDVDDLSFLNYYLKEKGLGFQAQMVGTKYENYLLVRVSA
jgi:hypothetical protein